MRAVPPFRLEHIGSLVRPRTIINARARHQRGEIGSGELRALEDAEIAEVVAWQCEHGLRSVTDGEFRRASYTDSFGVAAFDGLRTVTTDDPDWQYTDHEGRTSSANMSIVDSRLEWRAPVNLGDYQYLVSVTPAGHVPKMTLPGPCHIHFRSGREHISKAAYPDLDLFWSDIIEGYVNEIDALYQAGCRYLQLDETSLAKFGDPRIRRALEKRGDDWRDLLELYTDVINEIVARMPADMAVGIHLCRGNKSGAWQSEGGYDDIAHSLFRKLVISFYFLEYDSPRAGSFESLAEVPDDKMIVLGLVSTKLRDLESVDQLRQRVETASQYVPLDRLCVSPQCGFAGDLAGTGLSREEQGAKIDLLGRLATEIWGPDQVPEPLK